MARDPRERPRPGHAIPEAIDLKTLRPSAGPYGQSFGNFDAYGNPIPGIPPDLQPFLAYLNPLQFATLLNAFKKWRGRFLTRVLSVGVAAINLLPDDDERTYFFCINTHATQRIFLGFDYMPDTATGIPIEANLGFFEPEVVPTNEVNVIANGANTTLVCYYMN